MTDGASEPECRHVVENGGHGCSCQNWDADRAALEARVRELEAKITGMPCYRINWQRDTRELDCGALQRTRSMTDLPFEAIKACPACTARAALPRSARRRR